MIGSKQPSYVVSSDCKECAEEEVVCIRFYNGRRCKSGHISWQRCHSRNLECIKPSIKMNKIYIALPCDHLVFVKQLHIPSDIDEISIQPCLPSTGPIRIQWAEAFLAKTNISTIGLYKLDLRKNLLKGSLPTTVDELYLGQSKLDGFPLDIEIIRNLKVLDLSSITMTTFFQNPTIHRELQNLRHLRALPYPFQAFELELNSLETLEVSGISNTAFPKSIFKMDSLTKLRLYAVDATGSRCPIQENTFTQKQYDFLLNLTAADVEIVPATKGQCKGVVKKILFREVTDLCVVDGMESKPQDTSIYYRNVTLAKDAVVRELNGLAIGVMLLLSVACVLAIRRYRHPARDQYSLF